MLLMFSKPTRMCTYDFKLFIIYVLQSEMNMCNVNMADDTIKLNIIFKYSLYRMFSCVWRINTEFAPDTCITSSVV